MRAFALALLGLLAWHPTPSVGAEAGPFLLEHLSTLDGLPQGTVYASLQDSQGFVWFGTEEGLVRYDGHDIRRYAFDVNSKNGLPGNFVFDIVEDRRGDLWLAIKGAGLARWDRATDTFTVYRHDKANAASISSDYVRTLIVDSQDRIWLGTMDAGVDVLEPATGRIRHLHHQQAGATASLANDQVYALFEDRRGEVWIGTKTGIDRWLLNAAGFVRSAYLKGQSLLAGHEAMEIIDGNDGTIWVGTFDAGVYHLDYSGTVIENLRHHADQDDSISNDEVHALLVDHARRIWVGTAGGLDYIERSGTRVGHYLHDKTDSASLSDSFIMSLYEDRAGLLWIGTRSGGVNRWNSHSWEWGGSNPGWLQGKMVTAFADAADGDLWVGTLGGGLYDFDPRSGHATNLDVRLQTPNVLGDSRVMSLLRDRRGALWIGTWSAGLKRLGADGQLTSIPVKAGDAHSLSAAGVAVIFEAKNGQLWIGTHGGGANILDPVSGAVHQLPSSTLSAAGLTSSNVTAFTEDPQGNIWIGTENGGIDVADAQGNVFKTFTHDVNDPRSLSADIIYSLATDDTGRVWVGTDGGGLDLAAGSSSAPDKLHFERFTRSDGLSSETIYAVVPDVQGQLWLSGNAGLMRFDPQTHGVITIHREHGLQGEEFNSGAFLRSANGRLCFGGPAGINVFDPAKVTLDSPRPRVALTGLEILGVPVQETTPYASLHDITLDYRASIVSFDFAALDFKSPNRNRLAYRVSGLTDQWIDLGSQRRFTLTNLDSGDHVLEVRAANADSSWSMEPYRLRIHKRPAPWRSAGAYTLYALLLTALIASGLRRQRVKLRRALAAQLKLEFEVDQRTQELKEANRQLIVASEAKNDFLSRMGHELRTPMNGVVGMTELLARAPLPSAQARQVQTIRSSAQTLLQILNDLLDLSKAQAGKIELESLPVDITQLIEECVAMFAGAAETKGLSLFVCPAPSRDHKLAGDPLRIRQILMNLIGNAIKFTERGEVVISWDVVAADAAAVDVRITIADTGVGINDTAINKIFEPFTQADETTTRRFGGTGLGLSICQQLVGLMGGTINVDSRVDGGSVFTVSMSLATLGSATVAIPALKMKTVVITRRLAFAESLRRYLRLLNCESRVQEPWTDATVGAEEIVIVDADSCPREAKRYAKAETRRRTLIIASSSAVKEQQLETLSDEDHLLRGFVPLDILQRALGVAGNLAQYTVSARVPPPLISGELAAHVLIVEDDAVNATVAEGYLTALGCTSAWVRDGASAVARCATESFDLIFMDLNMPGLDGYETSRRIRAGETDGRRVPIIALTANAADAYRDACLTAGMDDILTKPYTLDQCLTTVRRWLAARSAAQTARPSSIAARLARVDLDSVAGFRGMGGLSGGLFAKLVTLFKSSAGDTLSQIEAGLAHGDLAATRALAHKLKGAAANVGALAFSTQLNDLEACCAAGDVEGARELLRALSAAHPALLCELQNVALRESA